MFRRGCAHRLSRIPAAPHARFTPAASRALCSTPAPPLPAPASPRRRHCRDLCAFALFVCGRAHTFDANPHRSPGEAQGPGVSAVFRDQEAMRAGSLRAQRRTPTHRAARRTAAPHRRGAARASGCARDRCRPLFHRSPGSRAPRRSRVGRPRSAHPPAKSSRSRSPSPRYQGAGAPSRDSAANRQK